ncbi:hypothetical protein [Streptomyces sp. I05A-00742]|uniref:hypothetical protein n=1 Tax=Streptomyces sp. I05A-00742 TaxID=2732853 RepID=UPI0014883D6B|nr:hypothetical protein [Streptomyces sp. I05A-00742]
MSASLQDLKNLRESAKLAAGPWFLAVLVTADEVTDFANIDPPLPAGGLVVSRRSDGQFDVWWRL